MAQYVMSMLRVSKIVPPKRQIIKDISLSFFPGAKIGLLGLNGSGKSTVLRIMAGVDKEYDGEVQHHAEHHHRLPAAGAAARPGQDRAPGSRIRHGRSDAGAEEARRSVRRLCRSRMPTSTSWPTNRRAWKAIIAAGGRDTEHQLEIAADALRLPPWDAVIKNLSGGEKRRVALCKLLL